MVARYYGKLAMMQNPISYIKERMLVACEDSFDDVFVADEESEQGQLSRFRVLYVRFFRYLRRGKSSC